MTQSLAETEHDPDAGGMAHAACNPTPVIVAIGASAGGLEAVEQFLAHMPASSGLAFVVVQHLDPAQAGMMPELLQRVSPMPVVEIENDMAVEANHVYIIPPSRDLSILHGRLQLLEPVPVRGMWQPIDYFFRALAQDCRERAIGVVLSGMGTDGTLGLRAIKEKHGLALVQEPDTTRFASMPKSAMTAVVVDLVAPPDELPAKLLAYLEHALPPAAADQLLDVKSHHALEKIVALLREHSGHDLSLYKKSGMYRRIERRMSVHRIDAIDNYVRYLRQNPQELDLLFKELLIGVTSFFRDAHVWETLRQTTIPQLLERYPFGREFRAWVPACSTGEEAYSLAMTFLDVLEELRPGARYTLQIFATDLDQDSIEQARRGLYPASIAAELTADRLARHFIPEGTGFRVRDEVREQVIFACHNLLTDAPFTRLDLLSCRNLLIYLGADLQQRLFQLFHYALNQDGILLLGSAEAVDSRSELFVPLAPRLRLYQRREVASERPEPGVPRFPLITTGKEKRGKARIPAGSLQSLADRYLLQHFAPAAVLVNPAGDILYISGSTGRYLEPAAGKANWNIHAMAREELRHELSLALKKGLRQGSAVSVRGLTVSTDGEEETIDLQIEPIVHPQGLKGLTVIAFTLARTNVLSLQPGEERYAEALRQAQEDLRELRETMRQAEADHRADHEELEALNRELQGNVEELTTAREEMQSINEELRTINKELQAKIDDLAWAGNDLNNLVIGADLIAVTLDERLHIRRFTPGATRLLKLIPGDIGRPLSDIAHGLDYAGMDTDALEVLRTLVPVEKVVEAGAARYRLRIVPYRGHNEVVEGVLISLVDLTIQPSASATARTS